MQAHLGINKLYEEVLIPGKRTQEGKKRGKEEPYFYGVEYEPLSLTMNIYFLMY